MKKAVIQDTLSNQVNTGCEMSEIEHDKEVEKLIGPAAASNTDNSLRARDGKLFELFTEMDVRQMEKTFDEMEKHLPISEIDLTATACRFDKH